MKHRFLLIIFLVTFLSSLPAYAVPISGDITFGGVLVPGTDLGVTTNVPFLPNTFVTSSSGDIAGFLPAGSTLTFNSFSFAPFTGSSNPLWQAPGIRFDLMEVSVNTQNALTLSLQGLGTVIANGFESALYKFSLSADKTSANGVVVAYSATQVPLGAVPEPSAGVLFASGVGLLLFSRIKKKLGH